MGVTTVRGDQLRTDTVPGNRIKTTDSIQVASVELGNASDNTLARSGSGAATLEGNQILTTALAREKLTADRTYYVRTDGNDSNNGLTDSSGGAFLTLNKARDAILALDLNGKVVTVQVGSGTYTAGLNWGQAWVGGGSIVFQGDTTTPSNVVISLTGDCFYIHDCALPGLFTIKGFKCSPGASNVGVNVASASGTVQVQNMDFAACYAALYADFASTIKVAGAYTISANATLHMVASQNSIIYASTTFTVTLTGTPTFSSAFVQATRTGVVVFIGITFSGSVGSGVPYIASGNGVIDTNGGGAGYFPGGGSGSSTTGGQYI